MYYLHFLVIVKNKCDPVRPKSLLFEKPEYLLVPWHWTITWKFLYFFLINTKSYIFYLLDWFGNFFERNLRFVTVIHENLFYTVDKTLRLSPKRSGYFLMWMWQNKEINNIIIENKRIFSNLNKPLFQCEK